MTLPIPNSHSQYDNAPSGRVKAYQNSKILTILQGKLKKTHIVTKSKSYNSYCFGILLKWGQAPQSPTLIK